MKNIDYITLFLLFTLAAFVIAIVIDKEDKEKIEKEGVSVYWLAALWPITLLYLQCKLIIYIFKKLC